MCGAKRLWSAFRTVVEAEGGTIDILVSAVGITMHQTVCSHGLKDWSDVTETNLTGPFLTMKSIMPGMSTRHWGRIVNIASTATRTAVADHLAYCVSKSGLLGCHGLRRLKERRTGSPASPSAQQGCNQNAARKCCNHGPAIRSGR